METETYSFPVVKVDLAQDGTLIDAIGIENVRNIYCLKLSGNINGTDILAIRKLTNLKILDMEDASIVNGGASYYRDFVTSKNTVGSYFFNDNTNLIRITLPSNLTAIGDYAFCRMAQLKHVRVPNKVKTIDSEAFYGCVGLKSVNIPRSVQTIGENAFEGCTSLASVEIEDLGSWCGISFLSSAANPLSYAHSLYLNGTELKEVTIPSGVQKIGSFAFTGCNSFVVVNIPDNVTDIEDNAFENCEELTTLSLGKQVKTISYNAFSGCPKLMDIYSLNTTPPVIEDNTFDENTEWRATLHVPDGCRTIYWLHPYWENFYNIQAEDLTAIPVVINGDETDGTGVNGAVYSVSGQRYDAHDLPNLPKGVYIIGGKKVYVK